ncbi:hypothetical protein FA10DRAFT_289502 [Acaromyces ingoldii]|uniref:Peptidase S9 prolyl oligopeptidase catalytic domain-containing protein n=1 Tax=Acaromyces ingoldii TaxID=215250 RepID=A0A316YBI7_9BASI|nr:hypothetical protein FA10DRAFT_289502 [Acaromyces ingoldii]PWN86926.1 hypothetical protein FA10DRAFT_289502 [Acaromyces ingoldii]
MALPASRHRGSAYIENLGLGAIYPMTNLTDEHYATPLDVPDLPPIERSSVQAYIDGPLVAGAPPDFEYKTGVVFGRHRAALYMAQHAQWRSWSIRSESQDMLDKWNACRAPKQGFFPPTFLLHSNGDMKILPSNPKDMANVLAEAGIDCRLHLVPDQAHFFDMIADPDDVATLDRLEISHMFRWLISALYPDSYDCEPAW